MNSKTVLGVIIGGVAGLTLAMGTMAFAFNGSHMGNNSQTSGMMGQVTQQADGKLTPHAGAHNSSANQTTHGAMHTQGKGSTDAHHTNFGKTATGAPCHSGATVKG